MTLPVWQPRSLEGLSSPTRPNVLVEAIRLRQTFGKAELRKLCELVGGVPEPKTVTRVVEKYYRGVPQKSEE